LNGSQKQAEKRIHQRDAGQGFVLDLVCRARFALSATSIRAIQHQVDDDERETG
jgi:hypothetical protein